MIDIPLSTRISRRTLIGALAADIAVRPVDSTASKRTQIKAVVFDAFPIFDPRSIAALTCSSFPKEGEVLSNLWSAKLFGYTWFCAAAGHYEDFESLADKSLQSTLEAMQLSIPTASRTLLVGAYSRLDVWSDVMPALEKFRNAGLRLGFLSNLSEQMLRANMRRTNIAHQFEHALSTDRVRTFKPEPTAYHMAIEAFALRKDEIAFVAFAGWDAAGATWFGYRTAWANRLGTPHERVGPRPAIVSRGIESVLALAGLD
jgi:2-haloacid dehalogenase